MTMRITSRLRRMLALAPLALTLVSGGAAATASELTVYTALEADQLKTYKATFEASNPDVEILWVRDSTGIITAKLLAEKANPKADVILGLAATSLMLLEKEGMLMPYAPAGLDKVNPTMRDPANPPQWVGMDVWASALCITTLT
jgi:iron(III) transport system substrate-binding protein